MDESGSDDVLGLVLERVDSHVSLIRAAAVCRRWRRAIADAAFLRRYRSLHAPLVAGYYRNEQHTLTWSHVRPTFVPSSPSMVDARSFSLDFLPDGADSWTILDSRGSFLLLCEASSVKFPDKVICLCEPLTRHYWRIHPLPDWDDDRCYHWKLFLLDGESSEAGGRISMSNFRVLCVFVRDGVTQAAMYAMGSSWSKKNIDPRFKISVPMGHSAGCWYFVQGRALTTLDGRTGDFSSSELLPLRDWDSDTWTHNFFITNGRDGKLHIFTVYDNTMKMFTRLEGGEWVLEKMIALPEATRGLPGYKPSFFSGHQYILTIGAGFVILMPQARELWPFSINLETMEAAPVEQGMGLLVFECELPWPPALHACLDR
ncbi:unnamed protein product [Urochloa decumbens]|uniref:F-box domain-containing protein n=1 Tax=Urochloa decumbens TaxID=240449 RepID=A0ABC8W9T8_9POAL